jgi:membrane protease YdiL (CAAX protease family)
LANLRTVHPLFVMLLWLVAAFVVIGLGPMVLFPATNSFVRPEAVLWKMFGASLFLGASLYLLRKQDWGRDPLGLMPNNRAGVGLAGGFFGGAVIVLLCVLIFRVQTPFHFERGAILGSEFAASLLVYLFGALLEELAFRGYPLLRLKRHYGSVRATLIVALAFGILHLPGTSGVGAVKMMVTTGLCSIIFSIAYLRSGTLWTAVGLHMGLNVVMHSVFSGAGQSPSLVRTVFGSAPALPYDPGFASLVLAALIAIAGMILLWPRPTSSPEVRVVA